MWKTPRPPVFALLLGLAACGPGHPVNPGEHPTTVAGAGEPGVALVRQQLADARKLVTDRNWPEADKALQEIIQAIGFRRLPLELRHEVLVAAGDAAMVQGSWTLAHDYSARLTSLPNADFDDWLRRLKAATAMGDRSDMVSALTVLVQRWPARTVQFPPGSILHIIDVATRTVPDAALPLLQALYDAHWTLKWGIEPSVAWRDLILRLVEKGRLSQAIDVSSHVTDIYMLISMRADRRFDAVVAANAPLFDIDAAARRAFQTYQAAAEKAPDVLELQLNVIEALLRQQRYEAAVAACDSILSNIRSTNYPEKLYSDYEAYYHWILNERADLLERVGRWDEAVGQLIAASKLPENHSGNVSQLLNLAHIYCDLDRPREALDVISRITARTSSHGAMQVEKIRLNTASQLGDSLQADRSMQYLETHHADAPDDYEDALIYTNQLDRAAKLLLERLRDRKQRTQALVDVQTYAAPLRTPRQVTYESRWDAVIARPDVRAAIQRVGRIEKYRVEER